MEKRMNINGKKYEISVKMYEPKEMEQIIIACHGFGGDKESSTIKLLANEMVKNKTGVICFDLPGHGGKQSKCR